MLEKHTLQGFIALIPSERIEEKEEEEINISIPITLNVNQKYRSTNHELAYDRHSQRVFLPPTINIRIPIFCSRGVGVTRVPRADELSM